MLTPCTLANVHWYQTSALFGLIFALVTIGMIVGLGMVLMRIFEKDSQPPPQPRHGIEGTRSSKENSEASQNSPRGEDVPDFQIERFVQAQEGVYAKALAEIKRGRKRGHWMWYIFPQLCGLGRSITAKRYAVSGHEEARAYLTHPVLGPRLRECSKALLELREKSALEIFGEIDELKLRSCMTLFALAAEDNHIFQRVLDSYFRGERCPRTHQALGEFMPEK